jgi:hypothetical protein
VVSPVQVTEQQPQQDYKPADDIRVCHADIENEKSLEEDDEEENASGSAAAKKRRLG